MSTSLASQDQGITSHTHRENVGKIVFATSLDAVQFKNEIPTLFKNKFSATEAIYSRVYLAKSVGNTPHDGDKSFKSILMYDLYIDGVKVSFKKAFGMYRHVQEDSRTYFMEEITDNTMLDTWTSWRPTILPLTDDPELSFGNVNIMARCFALALIELDPGTHHVELKMYGQDFASEAKTETLASGEFVLELTANDIRELAFKYAPPLPKDEWKGGSKEQLKSDIAIAFENQLHKKPIIVGLYGVDWSEGTYKISGVRYRKIAGWAVFEDGDGDGQVPITTFNWISDFSNGTWTQLRFDSHCLGCPDWDVEVRAVKAIVN